MIVDASVAMKWLIEEDGSEAALRLLGGPPLAAPDLLLAEVANAIWKKHRKGELASIPPYAAMLASAVDLVQPPAATAERALRLAVELDHPAYDCFYLAMAEATDTVLVTADARFARRCSGTPYANLVRAFDTVA